METFRLTRPLVQREKKMTYFFNFKQLCEEMKQSEENVSKFIFEELKTTGSISDSCLIIKGSFIPGRIEYVLKKMFLKIIG